MDNLLSYVYATYAKMKAEIKKKKRSDMTITRVSEHSIVKYSRLF